MEKYLGEHNPSRDPRLSDLIHHSYRFNAWLDAAFVHGTLQLLERVLARLGYQVTYRRLLEIGAGTGRVHPPLHDFGYEVYGVEKSEKKSEKK
jgi:SAM-dependent methyltransferase